MSHYQGDVDWREVARSGRYQFVYMKATEGHDFADDTFESNWSEAKANGMLVGAYHFFSSRSSGARQADHFISVVPVEEASLPPVIDLEIALDHDVGTIQGELKAMMDKLEDVYGKKPILYVTYATYNAYTSDGFEAYDIWIRDIVKFPTLKADREWTLWQYCNRGRVKGIDAYVDINVFHGDQDAFERRFKRTAPIG
ncbi:GH25 family lysozyme [Paenibacillus arenilitoris]|uniref:GH25 family lysozyme n=1 Tax=Paenibacillus arenilitoris TaxID=2772299 RepID=UPI00295B7958|nr:GH25 family lysozyme [Paenibacillus arenilitoris]